MNPLFVMGTALLALGLAGPARAIKKVVIVHGSQDRNGISDVHTFDITLDSIVLPPNFSIAGRKFNKDKYKGKEIWRSGAKNSMSGDRVHYQGESLDVFIYTTGAITFGVHEQGKRDVAIIGSASIYKEIK